MSIDVNLIKKTYHIFEPNPSLLADCVFETLFKKCPPMEFVFKNTDLNEFKQTLVKHLKALINQLDHIEKIEPYLIELGARHANYNVRQEYFSHFTEALLEAMAKIAGDQWNDEIEDAWDELFGIVITLMRQGLVLAETPV